MKQVKIVKASSFVSLENQINDTLENLDKLNSEVYQVTVGGGYDGESEVFIASVLYED